MKIDKWFWILKIRIFFQLLFVLRKKSRLRLESIATVESSAYFSMEVLTVFIHKKYSYY